MADCIVCSPPWQDQAPNHDGEANYARLRRQMHEAGRCHGGKFGPYAGATYGSAPGQLGAMKPGDAPQEDTMTSEVPVVTWQGCYDDSWDGYCVSAAMSHPAKFARGLAERIIEFGLAEGFWHKGDTVLDPFAGVGCGGVVCASHGLRWVGVELESRFVALAQESFGLHQHTWERFGDPLPTIIQADSRRLGEALQQAAGVVSSPPWLDQAPDHNGAVNLQRLHDQMHRDGNAHGGSIGPSLGQGYGHTPGQLAALPPGDVDAVTDSEPGTFWEAAAQILRECHRVLRPGAVTAWVVKAFVRNKALVDFPGDWARLLAACGFEVFLVVHASLVKEESHPSLFGGEMVTRTERKSFFRRLAEKKGAPPIDHEVVLFARRLGGPGEQPGDVGAVVASPPWAAQMNSGGDTPAARGIGRTGRDQRPCEAQGEHNPTRGYGTTPGQLAALPPGTPPPAADHCLTEQQSMLGVTFAKVSLEKNREALMTTDNGQPALAADYRGLTERLFGLMTSASHLTAQRERVRLELDRLEREEQAAQERFRAACAEAFAGGGMSGSAIAAAAIERVDAGKGDPPPGPFREALAQADAAAAAIPPEAPAPPAPTKRGRKVRSASADMPPPEPESVLAPAAGAGPLFNTPGAGAPPRAPIRPPRVLMGADLPVLRDLGIVETIPDFPFRLWTLRTVTTHQPVARGLAAGGRCGNWASDPPPLDRQPTYEEVEAAAAAALGAPVELCDAVACPDSSTGAVTFTFRRPADWEAAPAPQEEGQSCPT
jgi:hypothetical protein